MSAARILGWLKGQAVAFKAYCNRLEARVSAQRLIVSDVFGADTFVSKTDIRERSKRLARWDDGLDFDLPSVAPKFNSSDDEFSAVPVFLTRPRLAPGKDQSDEAVHTVRRYVPTLVCAGLLLVAWMSTGRTGPFSQTSPSAADAIAEQFASSSEGAAAVSHGTPDSDARLQFAPRFAVLYAELLSKDGVCADGGAMPSIQSAVSVMIRNLPPGTVLSAGEQVSATAWHLNAKEIDSVVVKIPADHNGPIQAKIEKLDESGGVVGQMAIEVRDTANDPTLGAANQRKKIYRPAGVKVSSAKRSKASASPQQAVAKAGPASAATTETETPAKQQFSLQLPFLPGPYSKKPPPGNTVGQQILINLGVISDVPATSALTQNN